ncbi:hypothetical protein FB45DRAFT_1063906 [Roridomyces roridus]|uniref:Uncharacterized protein n=1 Tax=Roridomyces roridus TaxID=1738132 RepID=A0AAD7BC73_9AGAR|nr:hypothetical protein FB45DRAFT_1063906 [Roridomyces roridus]
MQFNVALIASAILAAASPVLGAEFQWWTGAGCTGTAVVTTTNLDPLVCFSIANGGSTKSISYSGVPNFIDFYKSGGGNDQCTNSVLFSFGPGSGCATAPDGFNLESFFYG